MKLGYAALKRGSQGVRDALSAARSARNRSTRAARAADRDAATTARHHKRRLMREDRERERATKRRVWVQVPEADRPRGFGHTPRKLFSRRATVACAPLYAPVGRSADGLRSIHYAVVARGLASTTGRRWRAGEMARAGLYIVREEALEGGEIGWSSNVAADRNELVAFCRAVEEVERHDRANANVYVTEVIALDATMTPRQRRRVVKRLTDDLERRGLGYIAGLQLPDSSGDQRNFHVHLVYSLRPVERIGPYDWSFAVGKVPDLNTPDGIRARRQLVAEAMNTTLVAVGSGRRYTALSNRARGLAETPQPKAGHAATWVWRRLAEAEQRQAALDRLRDVTSAIRAGLDLADAVTELGRTTVTRLAAGRDRLERTATDAAETLSPVATLVRRRLAYATLSLASTSRDLSNRVEWMGRIAAERRRQGARLLAFRDEVGKAVADVPPLDAERERSRTALLRRTERIANTTHHATQAVAHLGPMVLERQRRRDWLQAISKVIADAVAVMPSLAPQAARASARLREGRRDLSSHMDKAAQDLATLANVCGDRLRATNAQLTAAVEQVERNTITLAEPLSMTVVPFAPGVSAQSKVADTGATVMPRPTTSLTPSPSRAAAPTPMRLPPGQDIGRALIERERVRRATAEEAATALPYKPDPAHAPGLARRIVDRFAERLTRPNRAAPIDTAGPSDVVLPRPAAGAASAAAKPVFAMPTGHDPARTEAIRLAVQAVEAAPLVPMRRSGPTAAPLEIIVDALPASSPLRAAAMLEDDPLVQTALRQRHDALVAVVERHLASNPARDRTTLLRRLRHADPAAAGAAVLLFADDEVAAMAARVAGTSQSVPVRDNADAREPHTASSPGAAVPSPVTARAPASPDPLVAVARLFHSDDWDPRDYAHYGEPPAIAEERAGPKAAPPDIDFDHLAWMQHQLGQHSR